MMEGPTPKDSFRWYTMYGICEGGISSWRLLRWKMRSPMRSASSGSSLSALKTTFRRSSMSHQPRCCVRYESDLQPIHELVPHVLDRWQDDLVLAIPPDLQPDAVVNGVE